MRISLIASSNKSGKALMGHVARTGEKKMHVGLWWGKLKERDIATAGRRR